MIFILRSFFRVVTNFSVEIYRLFSDIWLGAPVSQDWVDVILISLYKGKGPKSDCLNYRGISLFEAVGKFFAKFLFNLLKKYMSSVIRRVSMGL